MNKWLFIWLFAFLVLVKLSNPASAQSRFIIAGVWDTTDYYHDIIPDTAIVWHFGSTAYYQLDINNDSVDDFTFTSSTSWAAFLGNECVYLTAINGEFYALKNYYVRIFEPNDTIRNDSTWLGNASRRICYHTWKQCPPLCPGYGTYVNNSLHDKFLGVRYFMQSDTLYGWIRFSTSCGILITLQEWVINKPASSSGIGETKLTNSLIISPNPFRNETTLYSSTPLHLATLNIYNAQGKRVRQMKNVSGHAIPILRENLPAGLCFVHLTQQSSEPVTIKLIISD